MISHDEMLSLVEDLTEVLETATKYFDLSKLVQGYEDIVHCKAFHDGWHNIDHPFPARKLVMVVRACSDKANILAGQRIYSSPRVRRKIDLQASE